MNNFFNTLPSTPDQSLLPKVWLNWETKTQGEKYLNCETGQVQSHREEWMGERKTYADTHMTMNKARATTFQVAAGKSLMFAYAKYHESVQLLELAVVTMNTNRTGGARIWQYAGDRYFITKSKQIYDIHGAERVDCSMHSFRAYDHHSSYRFKDYLGYVCKSWSTLCFIEEFKKFIGSDMYLSKNGRATRINYTWNVQDWYETVVTAKSTGKTQKLIDTLSVLVSEDLTNICNGLYIPVADRGYGSLTDAIYYEKLNDEWSVLRYCYRGANDSNMESYRVFISESGKCHCAKLTNNNEWVPAQNINHEWNRTHAQFINMDEAITKSKRLSYIMPLVKTFPERQYISALTMAVKHPELEQLFKMGYTKLAENLMDDGIVNANIKQYVGHVNKKGKTLFSRWGINKYQMSVLDDAFSIGGTIFKDGLSAYRYKYCIKLLKKYLGNDISHLDNNTFDKLAYLMAQFCERYLDRNLDAHFAAMNIDIPKWLTHTARWISKAKPGESRVTMLVDTIKSYKELDSVRRPEINWYFDSYSDAVRAHDALIEIQRIQQRERMTLNNMAYAERLKKEDEMRQKIDEGRKHYEYEDDNFIIRLPLDNNEIVCEGSDQHICISNYVSSHSTGYTNLFFLRRKDAPNTPFYAIEMRDGNIIQIHGFGNKWLGNNPEAIPTVVRWLRKYNINCDQHILTCTATGYSRNGTYIPMPVVED